MPQSFHQFWLGFNALSSSKKLTVIVITTICVVSISALVFLANQKEYNILFSNLSADDAGEIIAKLQEKKVPYKLSPGGDSILVPSGKVSELRLYLASSGLPQGGVVGFEIFDKEKFGVTEFVQQLNYQRALQGELSRTINNLNEVQQSRVHITVPQKSLFVENQTKPTASVLLKLKAGRKLRPSQIDGITHLVASGVEGLGPEDVMVVDSSGNILSRAGDDSQMSKVTNSQIEYQRNIEEELSKKIESILERIVGMGKVVAKVSVVNDFKVTEKTEEVYDSEEPVARSVHRKTEKTLMPVKGGESTVSPINKGKINAYDTKHEKTDEVVNYEISRTVSKIIMPVGIIKKLSVAVLVDGVYHKNDKGVEEFQPRTKKAMATLGDLVKKAIGYDAERGDRVVVTSVPFRKAESDMDLTEEGAWSDQVTAYMPVIKYVLALIVLLFIVLFVLRPLIKSLLAKGHDEEVRIREIQTVAGGQLGSESSAYKLGESEAGVSKEVATVKQMAAQDSNSFSELLRNWLK